MAKKKSRVTPTRKSPANRERMAFPILLVMVMVTIVFGMFFYTGLLVAGSVIFAGYFGWLWWRRRAVRTSVSKTKSPARKKHKPRVR
jgi:Flp pilus assembly protein TadB